MTDPGGQGVAQGTHGRDLIVSRDITIEPTEIGKVQKVTIEEKKEDSATAVAVIITVTFAASTGILLLGIFIIVFKDADKAKEMIDIATPILKEAGSFLSTVFGPLLAFILGYYFSKNEKSTANSSSGGGRKPL